ncbi:MAG TPA: WD40 repeat domain-containing protein [Bradyrhizobium sp.]|nr:WD40 repeat domain-containing protein [Bradyrhizobium sp.]
MALYLCCYADTSTAQGAPAYTLPAGAEIVLQLGHASDGLFFVFSPDQRFILSAGGDQALKLWDVGSGRLLRDFEGSEPSSIDEVVFSPHGDYVLAAGAYGLRLWNVRTGLLTRTIGDSSRYDLANHAQAVAFSPDGEYLVAGYRDHRVRLWNSKTGKLLHSLEGHREAVGSVVFSPDGQFIFSASRIGLQDAAILQWDARSGAIVRELPIADSRKISTERHAFIRDALKISPDGRYLFAQGVDLKCAIWDIVTGGLIKRFTATGLSPDWRLIITNAPNGGTELRSLDTGAVIRSFPASRMVRFSPDGRVIGAIDSKLAISLWNVEDGNMMRSFLPRQKPIRAVAFARDGHRIITGDDAGLQIWNDATLVKSLRSESAIHSVALSADGGTIAAGRADRKIGLWEVAKGELARLVELSGFGGGYGSVTSVQFSPDSKTILGATGTTAQALDVATGAVTRTFNGADVAAFSLDGRRVVTGGGNIAIWNAGNGENLITINPIGGGVHAADFSRSGERIASGDDNHFVTLWDSRNGTVLRKLDRDQGNVRIVAFSPDGRSLLSGGFEKVLRLRNAESGAPVHDFRGHQGWVGGASFSPDGKRLASVGYDGTARLWDAETGQLLITTIVKNDNWLSITPHGLFVTSGDPREFFALVRGVEVLPMEEFVSQNRRGSFGELFTTAR